MLTNEYRKINTQLLKTEESAEISSGNIAEQNHNDTVIYK